jgi:hypothetical protein
MCLPPRTFGGRAGSTASQRFVTGLGRNFPVSYPQADAHGAGLRTTSATITDTDSAVGSSWA